MAETVQTKKSAVMHNLYCKLKNLLNSEFPSKNFRIKEFTCTPTGLQECRGGHSDGHGLFGPQTLKNRVKESSFTMMLFNARVARRASLESFKRPPFVNNSRLIAGEVVEN